MSLLENGSSNPSQVFRTEVLSLFGTRGQFRGRQFFQGLGLGAVSGLCILLLLFSHQVMSDSLRPRRLQRTRPLCPFMCVLHFYHCVFCFYYYSISSTSEHQALDPRGRAPLLGDCGPSQHFDCNLMSDSELDPSD